MLLTCLYKWQFLLELAINNHPPVPARPDDTGRSGGAQWYLPECVLGTGGEQKNMYIVYVLQDESGALYKGMTNNLKRRLQEHRSKQTKSTIKMNDIKVVYTETCATRPEARAREKYLKSAAGRRFLKLHIQ